MGSPNRKRFNNVSVGDGNFLVQLGSSRPPEVLVLSARPPRDRCQAVDLVHNRSNLCKSCCLQSEWINSSGKRQRECYAECGPRRAIDFELKAQADQPDGRLMILALEQLLKSPIDQPFRCHTSTVWAYYRKSNSTTTNSTHTHYASMAGTNQVPKLRIEWLELSWSQSDKRELVSLQFQPAGSPLNHHQHQQQVVFTRETLVLVELSCYRALVNSSGPAPPVASTPLHLLALIDRQQLNERPADGPPKQVPHLSQRRLNATITTSQQQQAPNTTTTTLPSIDTSERPVPAPGANELATTMETSIATTVESMLLPVPAFNGTQTHRFHLLATEFELIRHQLRANGLLFLMLLSLALLILIYTLCLCLKPALSNSTISGSKRRREKAKGKGKRKHQQLASMRISKPFNLQMPPATQIRLEAMMGHSAGWVDCVKTRDRLVPSSSGGWRILGAVAHPAAAAKRQQTKLLQLPSARQQVGPQLSFRLALKQHAANQLPDLSRGTIRMVRNLRSAASSARCRLKQSRAYQSNLHAIPELESELPRMRSSTASLIEIKSRAHRPPLPPANGNNHQPDRHHLESVVYDALSNECSHFVEKFNVLSQATGSATLFSKPDKSLGISNRAGSAMAPEVADSSNQSSAVQVSRSHILKQVKLFVKQPPAS